MIAIDTNVLVRYLVCDEEEQAAASQRLLERLSPEEPGFICREVAIELAWVLERAYRFSRERIAAVLDGLVSTAELIVEADDDVARAASAYRRGGAGFADLMIVAAAERADAVPVYTFDRILGRSKQAVLLDA